MKRALLAITALVTSSFMPAGIPPLVSGAAASPTPNILLCTDTSLLGPSTNGHFWGAPFLLNARLTITFIFDGPFGSGDTQYFVVTQTTRRAAIFQRCPVLNSSGHPTGRYQDVPLEASTTEVIVFNCQYPTTPAGIALGYVDCPVPAGNTVRGNPNK